MKLRKDPTTSGLPFGKWVMEQVSAWYEICRQNSNMRKEQRATMDRFLNYDDVNTLFYSKEFITLWLDDKRRENLVEGKKELFFDNKKKPSLSSRLFSKAFPSKKEKSETEIAAASATVKSKKQDKKKSKPKGGDALVGAEFKTYLEKSNKTLFGVVSWLSFYRNYYWLALFYCAHLTFALLLTTNWWWQKLIIGGCLVIGGYLLKLFADWWLEPPCPVPRADQSCPVPTDAKTRREKIVAWVMAGILMFFKTLINVFVFTLCEAVSGSLLERGVIHVIGIWGFVISGYFLDTLFIYNIHLAVIGYWYGKRRGVGKVKTWPNVQQNFSKAKKGFYKYILFPKSGTGKEEEEAGEKKLSKQQKRVAWAKFWNESVMHLHAEDYLSRKEMERLSFTLAEDRTAGEDFLSGMVVREPDLSVGPKNGLAQERLQEIVNFTFMKHVPTPRPMVELPSVTTLIPVYNETVIYSIDDVARPLNTGKTVLAFMIYKYPDEWHNFLERNGVMESRELSEIANGLVNGSFVGENLHEPAKMEKLSPQARDFLFEVRHWTSNRFQALSRTVRGINYRYVAYKFLARLQNPTWKTEEIEALCSQKFQLLVAYQTYANLLKTDNPSDLAKKEDLLYLSRKFPAVDICFILNEGGYFYGVRLNSGKEVARLWLPGFPILWEGKPENQVCALGFAWGDFIQALDMNQDGYFEEEIKFPNLLKEFEKDPWVKIVGFPERVTTRDFNSIGFMHAFSERTFTTCVNRVMSLYGVRQHYGHPDVFDGIWVETEGGMSKQCYVSEDIFGGYEVAVKGKRNLHVDYIQEAKGKEVGVLTTTKFFTKTSAGGAQQLYTRWLYWINNDCPNFPLIKRWHHFYLALGYYFEHTALKYSLAFFVFTRIIFAFGFKAEMGNYASSSVSAMFSPANLLLGVWVLQLGYLMGAAGFAEMLLERGWRGGLSYLKWFWGLLFFYIFHILTNASGFGDGMLSRAKYIPTGRTFMLEHVPFRNIYTAFKGSHLYYTFILVFTMFAWTYFIGFSTFAVIWSMLLCVLVWFTFPFMMNPGATPMGVPIKLWALLLYDDWVDFFKFSRKVLLYSKHLHWPAVFVLLFTSLVLLSFSFEKWWFMLLMGTCIGLLVPWLRMFYILIGATTLGLQTIIGMGLVIPTLLHRYIFYSQTHAIAPWLYGETHFDLIPVDTKKKRTKKILIRRKKKATPFPPLSSNEIQTEKPTKQPKATVTETGDGTAIINISIDQNSKKSESSIDEYAENEVSGSQSDEYKKDEEEEEVEVEVEIDEEDEVNDKGKGKENDDTDSEANKSYLDNTFTLRGAEKRRLRIPLAVENTFCFDRADALVVPAPRRTRLWDLPPGEQRLHNQRLVRLSTFHNFNDFRKRSLNSRMALDGIKQGDNASSNEIPMQMERDREEEDMITIGAIGATAATGTDMLPQPLQELLCPTAGKKVKRYDSFMRLQGRMGNSIRHRRDAQLRKDAVKCVSLFNMSEALPKTPQHAPSPLKASNGTTPVMPRLNVSQQTPSPLASSSTASSLSKSPMTHRYQLHKRPSQRFQQQINSTAPINQSTLVASNTASFGRKSGMVNFGRSNLSVYPGVVEAEEPADEIEGILPSKINLPAFLSRVEDPELMDLMEEIEEGDDGNDDDDDEEYASENDDDETPHYSDEWDDYEEEGPYH